MGHPLPHHRCRPPDPISSCVDGHGNGDRNHVWKDLDLSPQFCASCTIKHLINKGAKVIVSSHLGGVLPWITKGCIMQMLSFGDDVVVCPACSKRSLNLSWIS
ncbi:hypothetical protein BDA96_04G062800 [Sorghum bicolor]|uniref:Uncharacterized protein n=1 Tax=Sorghum bicolor TaxID=4558 RepID=A0A921UH34_SORBI|nr:hypothetical protein BDA96_04G062800 [Sorghum bicolor]KAG0531912.1 hypothetical protein BDA96_04G062800 [Sorghum bicolor]